QTFRQDPGNRRLAHPTRSGEEKRMVDATELERIDQRAADVLLSGQLGEVLRTPFARQRGVAHGRLAPRARDARPATDTPPVWWIGRFTQSACTGSRNNK